jgi:hypothetical protein
VIQSNLLEININTVEYVAIIIIVIEIPEVLKNESKIIESFLKLYP